MTEANEKKKKDDTPETEPQAEATESVTDKVEATEPATDKAEATEPLTDKVEAAEPATEKTEKTDAVEAQPTSRTAPALPEGTHYIWGTGRRKSAVARVRIRPGSGKFMVNKRDKDEYFTRSRDQQEVISPLKATGMLTSYDVYVNVGGGGATGQAGAVSLGLARAMAKHMPEVDHNLREKGLLTRDARMKERKKPGQPGARKRFQFSKR